MNQVCIDDLRGGGSPLGEPQKKKRRAQKLCFPAFITLRAGPPTRLSIPRLRLHTSSSTSYLGPPLLIYISLGVLSLDPGGAWAAVLPYYVVLFFSLFVVPPNLWIPQHVWLYLKQLANNGLASLGLFAHPKRPSMATEWQKNDYNAVYVVVRVIWYARPTVFLAPKWLLDPPKRKMIQNDVLTSKIVDFDFPRLKRIQN